MITVVIVDRSLEVRGKTLHPSVDKHAVFSLNQERPVYN